MTRSEPPMESAIAVYLTGALLVLALIAAVVILA